MNERKQQIKQNQQNFLKLTDEQRRELIQNNTLEAIRIDYDLGGTRFLWNQALELGVKFKTYQPQGRRKLIRRIQHENSET